MSFLEGSERRSVIAFEYGRYSSAGISATCLLVFEQKRDY